MNESILFNLTRLIAQLQQQVKNLQSRVVELERWADEVELENQAS